METVMIYPMIYPSYCFDEPSPTVPLTIKEFYYNHLPLVHHLPPPSICAMYDRSCGAVLLFEWGVFLKSVLDPSQLWTILEKEAMDPGTLRKSVQYQLEEYRERNKIPNAFEKCKHRVTSDDYDLELDFDG